MTQKPGSGVKVHPPRPSQRRFFGDGALGQGGGAMRREWFFQNESQREEAVLGTHEERAAAALQREQDSKRYSWLG